MGTLADLADLHEERAVGVAQHVFEEHGLALADVEFLEDDVTHGLRQAPSVPGWTRNQSSANFVLSAKSGDTTTTFWPW